MFRRPAAKGLLEAARREVNSNRALLQLPDLQIYGSDGVAEVALASGAAGVISALANVVPTALLELERALAQPGAPVPVEVSATLREIRSLTHSMPQRSSLKTLPTSAAASRRAAPALPNSISTPPRSSFSATPPPSAVCSRTAADVEAGEKIAKIALSR